MHIELTDLITEETHLSFDRIAYVGSAMLMDRGADEGIVFPFLIEDAIVGHGVVEETLALIHSEDSGPELEFGIIGFAEGDGEGISDREYVRSIMGADRVVVSEGIEGGVVLFLYIATVGTIGFEDMGERDEGYMLYLDGIAFDAFAVHFDFDGVDIFAFAGDGILVMEVTAEIAILRHGVESDGYILRRQFAA